MAVRITSVEPGSPARRARIHKGDTLISINGNAITDVLDYRFYMTDEHLEILLCDQEKKLRTVVVEKDEYDDLGLEFETYLMDRQMGCKNACIFCFVDQTPPGMRKSLYFKDDDTRMSFLFGNYTTLTNLKEGDIQRIIKMHISPINISIQTMNPALRVQQAFPQVQVQVKKIRNDFWGPTITVAGLITGQDLLAQLEGLDLGSELLIPANRLRHEQDSFLDDLTLEQVQETLGVPVLPVENDAFELLARMLGSR